MVLKQPLGIFDIYMLPLPHYLRNSDNIPCPLAHCESQPIEEGASPSIDPHNGLEFKAVYMLPFKGGNNQT